MCTLSSVIIMGHTLVSLYLWAPYKFILYVTPLPEHKSTSSQLYKAASTRSVSLNFGAISCPSTSDNVLNHKAISHAAADWNEAAGDTKGVSMATVLRNQRTAGGHFQEGLLPVIRHNHGGHISQTCPALLINTWEESAVCEEMLCSLCVLHAPTF